MGRRNERILIGCKTNIILTEVNGRMIDKRVNPFNINLDIDIPVMDKETIEEFQEEIQKIHNKYIGQAQDSMLLHQIVYDMEKLLQNKKYNGITVKNNEFFTEELWSLKKLLEVYNTEYPDRRVIKDIDRGTTQLVDIERAEGDITEPGTKLNASNFNDLEDRIASSINVVELAVADKQDKLTAGSGISIENNVISISLIDADTQEY